MRTVHNKNNFFLFFKCLWALSFIMTTIFKVFFTVYGIAVSVALMSTSVVAATAPAGCPLFEAACSAAHCCCSAASAAAALGYQAAPFRCRLH